MTTRMCSTTGMGWAKNRAFAVVTSAPPASCASLAVPAIAGTRLNRISAPGTTQSDRRDDVVPGARGAFSTQRLEAAHIVACLDAHAHSADTAFTAHAAVCRKVVGGI